MPLNRKVRTFDLDSERARMLVSFGLGKGLTVEQCLESSGITSCSFFDKIAALDDSKEIRLIDNIISNIKDCSFALGFEFGQKHQLNLLNKASPSIFSSKNLSVAISVISGSISALFNLGSFRLSLHMPALRLAFDVNDEVPEQVSKFILGRNIGLIVAIHSLLLQSKIQGVKEIGFAFPESLESAESLDAHFECPVVQQQAENYLLLDLMKLDFSQPLINEIAAKVISGNCCQGSTALSATGSMPLKLRDKIWALLNDSDDFSLTKDDAAAELNLSPRTFSRRLQEEQTTWRNLVSDLRMKKARILLSERELTLQQIAGQIGFSSASAFSNAFSKANGVNAAEYRRKQNFRAVFEMPKRLIGREKELEKMHQAVEKSASGLSTMVLISGEPGVGKTALAREFYQQSSSACLKVLSGKFDQYHKEAPLSSLTLSLNKMIQSIISEGTAEAWRERWLSSIGEQGAVLIKRFPQFELILGPQCKVNPCAPRDEYQQFVSAFKNLLKASGTPEHPLVLFVDDLQWADVATIDLLETILTEAPNLHLLVIGTYRTTELVEGHPLKNTLLNFRENGVAYDDIAVPDLSSGDVQNFIEASLLVKGNQLQSLVKICVDKTQGNPFYLICLLQELIQQGALKTDAEHFSWCFDAEKASGMKFTENVVRILESKLNKQPAPHRSILNIGALLGSTFDYYDLLALSGVEKSALNALISQVEDAGFVVSLNSSYKNVARTISRGDSKIEFIHDRIQQAVIESISKEEITGLHYQIGQQIKNDENQHATGIFELVGHLSSAETLLRAEEKVELAGLSLKAAKQARLAAAWHTARNHARYGINLLGPSCWENYPDLSTRLYIILAECLSFLAEYEQADEIYQNALSKMMDPLSRARIRSLELTQMTIQGEMREALDAGLAGLAELGVDLTGEPGEVQTRISFLVDEVLAYSHMSIEQLLNRPTSNDPKFLAISQLSKGCSPAAFLLGEFHTYTLMVLHSAMHSLKHGYTSGSCLVLAAVAPMLPSEHASYCHRLSRLSNTLSSRFNDPTSRVESLLIFALYASSWRDTYRDTENLLRDAIRIGSKSGDRLFLSYCPPHLAQLSLFNGRSLKSINALCDHHMSLMNELDVDENKQILCLSKATVCMLINRSGKPSRFESLHDRPSENVHQSAFIASTRLFFAVYMRDFEGAKRYIPMTLDTLPMHSKQYYEPERLFLIGLALVDSDDQQDLLIVKKCLQELMRWSTISPDNHLSKLLILKAEMARKAGRYLKACEAYDEAIEQAHEQSFVHHEALAAELAGRYLYSEGKSRASERYLKQAYEQYEQWGAGLKLAQLEREFTLCFVKQDKIEQKTIPDLLPGLLPGFRSLSTEYHSIVDND